MGVVALIFWLTNSELALLSTLNSLIRNWLYFKLGFYLRDYALSFVWNSFSCVFVLYYGNPFLFDEYFPKSLLLLSSLS
jgi:hypothetical protein